MFNSGEYIPNNNKQKIIEILQSNGYKVQDCGNYIQFPGLWRGGDDLTSITCYPDDNKVIDWVSGEKFDIKSLFSKVLNLKSENEVNEAIKLNNITLNVIKEQEIEQKKTFDKEYLLKLQPDYSYPLSRGISEETCKLFQTGKVGDVKGKQKNRFLFPIFDSKGNIVGFTGRTLINDKIKYKHSGCTKDWVWPAFLNHKIIRNSKFCILVESPFCVLKLWENGIKNVLCLFGVELNLSILNFFLKTNIEKIVIATNNELDSKNGGVGNQAAIKIKNKLCKYFDAQNCIIKLPPKKDFADCSVDEINKYKEELRLLIGEKYFSID